MLLEIEGTPKVRIDVKDWRADVACRVEVETMPEDRYSPVAAISFELTADQAEALGETLLDLGAACRTRTDEAAVTTTSEGEGKPASEAGTVSGRIESGGEPNTPNVPQTDETIPTQGDNGPSRGAPVPAEAVVDAAFTAKKTKGK